MANLKLATTDETDALSYPPASAIEKDDNIVYGPEAAPNTPMCTSVEDNTQEMTDLTAVGVNRRTSIKRRKHLRKSPLLRRIINMPDLSRIYDERGVYKSSFWKNPAVTGSEEAISTTGLFPVIVPGCEGAKETQNNNFSFLFKHFVKGGEDRNAHTLLNLGMTATLAPEYPILSLSE